MLKSPKKLMLSAIIKFVVGISILGAFLFFCGGDFAYLNAWIYISAFAVCIFSLGVYLFTKDKELLEKRLNSKEKEDAQKAYTVSASVSLIATFGVCGLDYRFSWSSIPIAVVIIALVVMLAGYPRPNRTLR